MCNSVMKLCVCTLLLVMVTAPVLAGNNSDTTFSTWSDTGQTKCYNNTAEIPCPNPGQPFYGQDAQYTGPSRSYTVLRGGTMVQDNVTGLVWEIKNSKDDVVNYNNPNDADNTYSWCDPNPTTNGGFAGNCVDFNAAYGQADSKDFINQLNNGSGFGGYTDWRLPTINELATLADFGRSSPSLDPVLEPIGTFFYWSATAMAAGTSWTAESAWVVPFRTAGDGRISVQQKIHGAHIRAVRGGQTPISSRYIDNKNGTVTDTITCLQWQKSSMSVSENNGNPVNWQTALSLSENLSLGGHDDWRLPNINELHSLLDYSRVNPAIAPVFDNIRGVEVYWSSTSGISGNTNSAWQTFFTFSDIGGGTEIVNLKSENAGFARAVRGRQCGELDNLAYTILALQIVSSFEVNNSLYQLPDVNNDNKIGIEEAIYSLQKKAGLR